MNPLPPQANPKATAAAVILRAMRIDTMMLSIDLCSRMTIP